ncbi:MAG: outer membrane lipoprotein carrier protein LolA [Bacteriovoracia bacterium]
MQKALIFLLFLSALPAQAIDRAKISPVKKISLDKLQATYKSKASLEADFIQEVYQASLARTKTSKGNIRLSKPNFVRWEIAEPEASIMVSNGRRVSYFTPDARGKGKGQVIERAASELERQPMFRILTGSAPLTKEFIVTKEEKIEGVAKGEAFTEIWLKPKKPMSDINEVRLRIDSKYLIRELNLENENGNKTKITLQNQSLGDKLPTALFDFKAPEGTEVIRN